MVPSVVRRFSRISASSSSLSFLEERSAGSAEPIGGTTATSIDNDGPTSVNSAGRAVTAGVSFTGVAPTTITAISSVAASAVLIRMPRVEERRERRNNRTPVANPMETSLGSLIANPVSPGLK